MFRKEDLEQLEKIPGALEEAARESIKELGLLGQEQMVHNLSGGFVPYSGGGFVVNVQTGNLRRQTRLEYPADGDPLEAVVFNRAAYSDVIENGISGEMKKQMILNGGKAAKVSKEGRRYKRVKSKAGFWTVSEKSKLKDQQARPFARATAEQLEQSAQSVIEQATEEVLREILK